MLVPMISIIIFLMQKRNNCKSLFFPPYLFQLSSSSTAILRRFDNDKDEFLKRVDATVQESLKRLYDSPGPSNPLVFTEPQPGHEELIKDIFYTRRTDLVTSHAAQDEAESEKTRLEKSILDSCVTNSTSSSSSSGGADRSTLLDADMSMMSMDSIDPGRR
jgi:hypothetical protein